MLQMCREIFTFSSLQIHLRVENIFFRQRFPPSTQRAGKPPRPLENVFNFGNLLLNEEMYRYETDGGCTVLAEEQNTHSTEHYFTRTNKSGTIFRVHSG